MNSLRFPLVFLALASAALAATPPPASTPAPKAKSEDKSGWVFSLLPKSLQKNPNLDLTVITEMTEIGKKAPKATPEKPVYYLTQSMGFHALGEVSGGEDKIPVAEVERILERSLAASSFLPAKLPEHPPTIVVFFVWGSHNLLTEPDPDNKTLSGDLVMRNLLDRAALVGGQKFAAKMIELFTQADALAGANRQSADPSAPTPILGQDQLDFTNPVYQFKRESSKNEFLVDQAASDCFYVVASAYDYKSVAEHAKILLWRTRMTANSAGVSQEQSLPTLITSAGPFFGKEMESPEVIFKRAVREGQVEVGTPTVVPSANDKSTEKK